MDIPLVKLKLWVTLGLVVLALFEFWTAMVLFGRKGAKKHAKLMLRLHRIGGYVFLVWWIWPMWVGLTLLGQLGDEGIGYEFHGVRSFHAVLAVAVFLLLLLKIGFVRMWKQYRLQAKPLGIAITVLTLVIWTIAGLFWLAMMGGVVVE